MRRFIYSVLIVSSLTFLISSTAIASSLIVDLKTNYLPGVEFTTARTILTPGHTQNTPVFTTSPVEDPGIRIADYRGLRNGHYRLVVQLLRPDESILDTRTISVALHTNLGTIAVFARPGDRGGPSIHPSPAGIVALAPVFTPPPQVSTPGLVHPGPVGTIREEGDGVDTGESPPMGVPARAVEVPEEGPEVQHVPSTESPNGDAGGDVAPTPARDGGEEVIVPSDDEPTSPAGGEMTTPVAHPISPRPEWTPIEVTYAQGGGCNLAAGSAGGSSRGVFVLLLAVILIAGLIALKTARRFGVCADAFRKWARRPWC
jgi:hypothetical protein